MANRSYLYSLSNRPISYQDRPETISGVSEWAYDVPFIFRLLMSGDPELCASLISEGLDGEPAGRVIPVHAIGASFEPGFERVQRFVAIVKAMIAMGLATAPQRVVAPVVAPPPASLMASIKRLVFGAPQAPALPPVEEVFGTEHLCRWLDATIDFLQAHRNTFLLLETIELDLMLESDEDGLRARVEQELVRCVQAGVALDALPADPLEAAKTLLGASEDGPGSMTALRDCASTTAAMAIAEAPPAIRSACRTGRTCFISVCRTEPNSRRTKPRPGHSRRPSRRPRSRCRRPACRRWRRAQRPLAKCGAVCTASPW